MEERPDMDAVEQIRGCRIPLAIIAIEADVPEAEIAAALKGSQALRFLQESRIARYLEGQDQRALACPPRPGHKARHRP